VFPEVWLSGYPYWTEGWDSPLQQWAGGRIRFRDAAIVAPSEDTERLGAAARKAGAYVVMGCNEMDSRPEVSTIYNALLFFDRDGRLMGRHRKTMPTFTERMFWGQGDASDLRVFDTDIGRLGGLICGEHLMTLVRAAMIGLGEEIHVAVFPGAFALHTGPRLEEWDAGHQAFWGHASVRAHALEAGAFVLSACGQITEADIPDDFPHKDHMNIGYAKGGSSIIAPLGIPLVGPIEGPAIVRAELQAWMIKAWKAIIDTNGHYARPDLLGLHLANHTPSQYPVLRTQPRPDLLAEAAEKNGVEPALVESMMHDAARLGVVGRSDGSPA
jgi:nitrilase